MVLHDVMQSIEPVRHSALVSLAPAQDQAMIAEEERKRVHAAIAALPLQFREVLVLREFHELSYREIAEVIGTPVGTVMSRLARAQGADEDTADGRSCGRRTRQMHHDLIWIARRFVDLLHPYADNELPPQERSAVAAHLGDCAACAQALAEIEALRHRSGGPARTPCLPGLERRACAARSLPAGAERAAIPGSALARLPRRTWPLPCWGA